MKLNGRDFEWINCVNMCRKAVNLAINDLDTACKKKDYGSIKTIEYQIRNGITCDVVEIDPERVIRTGHNLKKAKEKRKNEKK